MEAWLSSFVTSALQGLALPEVGLGAIFLVSFVSATLLPFGSVAAVFGLIKLQPELFWPAVLVATVGNTLGGAVSWWMGYGAEKAFERIAHHAPKARALAWLKRFGARTCLLAWLPIVGDPLCAVAGWLRLPFWPCVGYMAVGKFGRYVVMTSALLWFFPGQIQP
jgi:membrane protein YqaA with SNARE-associated domain